MRTGGRRPLSEGRRGKTLVALLEDVLEKLSVQVSYEDIIGRGGLCRCHDRHYLVMNRGLATAERAHLMVAALRMMPLEGVYLPPVVREMVEQGVEKQGEGRSEERQNGTEEAEERGEGRSEERQNETEEAEERGEGRSEERQNGAGGLEKRGEVRSGESQNEEEDEEKADGERSGEGAGDGAA